MKYTLYIIVFALLVSTLTSCQVTSLNGEIHETIYVRHQGADMPAYVHGDPSAKTFLIATHGAGSFGLSFRDKAFVSQLEEKYVVVYFDQRGQNMSQGHYSKPDNLIDLMVSDLEALTKVLKHKYGEDITLFLMGHSWGGLLTASALLKSDFQSQFNGWINVAGLMDLPSASQHRRNIIAVIADELQAGDKSQEEWVRIRTEALELDPETDYDAILSLAREVMNLLIKDEVVQTNPSFEKLYRTLIDNNPVNWQVSHLFNKPVEFAKDIDYSVLNGLGGIRIPSLFIYGKYDVSVPYTSGIDAFEKLGTTSKQFILFDFSIHHPYDTEPFRFSESVRVFIDANR